MKIKRIIAFFIDIFIVSIVSSSLFMLPVFKDNYTTYNNYYNDYMNEMMHSGSADVDLDKIGEFQYNIYKASAPMTIIRVGAIILYFGVLGFVFNGVTLGKKILHLKINPMNGNLNPGLFMLREMIVTGIFFDIISLVLLNYCSKDLYLTLSTYIGYANMFVYFLILGFMIFRDDERGLHDIICKTCVVNTKEK